MLGEHRLDYFKQANLYNKTRGNKISLNPSNCNFKLNHDIIIIIPSHISQYWKSFYFPFSRMQLYALRRLMQGSEQTPKAPLGNNARPVQSLHHRTVRTNIDFKQSKVSKNRVISLNLIRREMRINSQHTMTMSSIIVENSLVTIFKRWYKLN